MIRKIWRILACARQLPRILETTTANRQMEIRIANASQAVNGKCNDYGSGRNNRINPNSEVIRLKLPCLECRHGSTREYLTKRIRKSAPHSSSGGLTDSLQVTRKAEFCPDRRRIRLNINYGFPRRAHHDVA